MNVDVFMLLSLISTICAIFFGYKAYNGKNTDSVRTDVKERTEILTRLDHITHGVADIKKELAMTKTDFRNDHDDLIYLKREVANISKKLDDHCIINEH